MQPKDILQSSEVLTELLGLDEQIESLDSQNMELYRTILGKYETVLGEISSMLSDKSLDAQKRKELITLKREIDQRKKKFLGKFSEFAEADRKSADEERRIAEKNRKEKEFFEKMAAERSISESDKDKFLSSYHTLPDRLQEAYLMRLKSCLKQPSTAKIKTAFMGVLFELTRRALLIEQGLEKLDPTERTIVSPYLGYEKLEDSFTRPPTRKLGGDEKTGDIEFDVQGIMKDGKPYVYETKSWPRRMFGHEYGGGEAVTSRNQLLKYQEAAREAAEGSRSKESKISGASVEIQGRIDYQLLAWAIGEKIEEIGAVPRIEIIYNIELPSGKDYRFVLKRPTDEKGNPLKGLQFVNDDSDYTEEDKLVVAGIAQAVRDKSITWLIQDTNISREDAEAAGLSEQYLQHPEEIMDVETLDRFMQLRKETILKKLLDKGKNPKRSDKIAAYDERATSATVLRALVEYEEMLNANPELKAKKSTYVVTPDRYDEVVAKVMVEIERIKEFELKRRESAMEIEDRPVRKSMGYVGPEDGYPLDIEHILMDTLQDVNKTGEGQKPRSYSKPERFIEGAHIWEYLNDQDRSFTAVSTYDPSSRKHDTTTIVGDRAAKKDTLLKDFDKNLLLENIRRAEKRLDALLNKHKIFTQKKASDLTAAERAEFSQVQKSLATYFKGGKTKLNKARETMAEVETRKKTALEPLEAQMKGIRGDIARAMGEKIKTLSSQFLEPVQAAKNDLLDAYKEIFAREWDSFAKREVKREEANLIKFIYVIDGESQVILEEERIRGAADSSRAAHSELAQGRNIYGAGELSFTRDDNGRWHLSEINNGSGHYRPEHTILPYAKAWICDVMGINPNDSRIKLRNSLFRGLDIDGIAILE